MVSVLWLLCFTCIFKTCIMITNREELLLEDPSMWPGHLEPFGSQQPTGTIEVLNSWPDPVTFFREYIDKSRPVLFKGLAKLSPGFYKFDDEYFKNAPGADKTMIYAEPELKENRTKKGFEISVKEFIERYHKESLYMVNLLPAQYTPDVCIPAPLRCESTKKLMSSQVTWFSSGGTKSVLHNDDVDNINCLFRGSKELLFIEYNKNKMYVPIDMIQGGYSSLDVDKVNYTRFPELRKVDMYYKASMEEGDCLFIPYHWFHQVNSAADEKHMNLAVNVWFKHEIGHVPEGCDIPESEATIDKYVFPDDEMEKEQQGFIDHFSKYVAKNKFIKMKTFLKLFKRDPLINPELLKIDDHADVIGIAGTKIFGFLDINQDSKLSGKDFEQIGELSESAYIKLEEAMNVVIADAENFIEDLVEDEKKGKLFGDSKSKINNEKEEL